MFENLDQIDWKGLGEHVYQGEERIPSEIRNLLSQDAQIRQGARSFLLGGGQEHGTVAGTTPRMLPFLLEILAAPGAPGKAELLAELSDVAARTLYPEEFSAYRIRLYAQTYQAFKDGLGILIPLLRYGSKEVRLSCIETLRYMIDDADVLIPEFIRLFPEEQDEGIQEAFLQGLKVLLSAPDWSRHTSGERYHVLRKEYASFFRSVVESARSGRVRVAAAHAWVELVSLNRLNDDLSPQVAALFSEEFLNQSSGLDYQKAGGAGFLEAQDLIRDLARLGPEPLLSLLQEPAISAEQAHVIARGLLAQTILHSNSNGAHWKHFLNRSRNDEGLFYGKRFDVRQAKWLRKNRILQALLADERVWEIPSDMLSFFYGLPDTREALRALLVQPGSLD